MILKGGDMKKMTIGIIAAVTVIIAATVAGILIFRSNDSTGGRNGFFGFKHQEKDYPPGGSTDGRVMRYTYKTNQTIPPQYRTYLMISPKDQVTEEAGRSRYLGRPGEVGAGTEVTGVYRPKRPGRYYFYLIEGKDMEVPEKNEDRLSTDFAPVKGFLVDENLKVKELPDEELARLQNGANGFLVLDREEGRVAEPRILTDVALEAVAPVLPDGTEDTSGKRTVYRIGSKQGRIEVYHLARAKDARLTDGEVKERFRPDREYIVDGGRLLPVMRQEVYFDPEDTIVTERVSSSSIPPGDQVRTVVIGTEHLCIQSVKKRENGDDREDGGEMRTTTVYVPREPGRVAVVEATALTAGGNDAETVERNLLTECYRIDEENKLKKRSLTEDYREISKDPETFSLERERGAVPVVKGREHAVPLGTYETKDGTWLTVYDTRSPGVMEFYLAETEEEKRMSEKKLMQSKKPFLTVTVGDDYRVTKAPE